MLPARKVYTFFHIDPSKSADILKQFLGETFAGVVGCDYAGEYRRFTAETDAVLQFCWAHLIRDVKFLTTLPDPVTCRFGDKLLEKIKALFAFGTAEKRPRQSVGNKKRQVPGRTFSTRCGGRHYGRKSRTLLSASATTGRTTSLFSNGRACRRPTTASSSSSVSSSSTARSRKARGANQDVVGANGFGPPWRPVPSAAAAPLHICTKRSRPTFSVGLDHHSWPCRRKAPLVGKRSFAPLVFTVRVKPLPTFTLHNYRATTSCHCTCVPMRRERPPSKHDLFP